MNEDQLNELSRRIIGAAIEVHRELGPGLLEEAYKVALAFELRSQMLKVDTEVSIPVSYKLIKLNVAYRADIIVEDEIIVELKSTDKDNPLYRKQLYTYLRLRGKRLGLLINFNKELLIDGVTRVVNNL